MRTGVGGTGHLWGGRCVPFDPEDFQTDEPTWPISWDEYIGWVGKASAFLGCTDQYSVEKPPGWPNIEGFRCDSVERLSAGPSLIERFRGLLAQRDGPDVVLGATAGDLEIGSESTGYHVQAVRILSGAIQERLVAKRFAICCGGLATTRLLLKAQQSHPSLFGAGLGRYYMGHLTGSISEIVFSDPRMFRGFGYQESDGSDPARRRFTPSQMGRTNIALWVDNLGLTDARHGSGTQSLKYLAMRVPWLARRFVSDPIRRRALSGGRAELGAHLGNVLKSPITTFVDAASLLGERFGRRDRPADRLAPSRAGRYRLSYHAEHLPNAESQVVLSQQTDDNGLPMLDIDFRFTRDDFLGVVEVHERLSAALADTGMARLEMPGTREDQIKRVHEQARDGYHQIGTTRMSSDSTKGVVDTDCRVHGVENLFIASSSIFPRSSQANPTLSIVAFAIRLGRRIIALSEPDVGVS